MDAVMPSCVGVEFLGGGGKVSRGPLVRFATERFEQVAPVRAFPSFRGQRNFPGSWWWATTGAHVGFESWLERDHVMLLDFDPTVVALASQPFWLSWSHGGRARRHAPDFFARLADGTAVVVDVRPDDRIGDVDAEVFSATASACESVGWDYRRVGVVDAVLAANVRWLAGYRHQRHLDAALAGRLVEVCNGGKVLAEVPGQVGDRLAVLPVLFHLLWIGVLQTDLRAAALGPAVVVRTAAGLAAAA